MKIQLSNTDVTAAIQDYIKKVLPAFADQEIALEYTLTRGVSPQLSIDLHIGADAQVFLDARTKAFAGSGASETTGAAVAASLARTPRTVAPKVKAEEQLDLEVVEEDEPAIEADDEAVEVEAEAQVEAAKPRRSFARKS